MLVPVDPWTPLALLVLAAPAVVHAGRIPWSALGRAALLFGPFAFSLLAVNAVTRDGPVVAEVAGLEVTRTGLAIGAALAVRTVLVGTLAVAFSLTTDGARLMTSLHQHARLGARPTFAVLAGYRVLEDLPERWTTIRQAQSVRDPRLRRGALPTRRGVTGPRRVHAARGRAAAGRADGDRDGDPRTGLRSADRAPARCAGPAGRRLRGRSCWACAWLVMLVSWRSGVLRTWATA